MWAICIQTADDIVPRRNDGGTMTTTRAAGRCDGQEARTTDKTLTRLSVIRDDRPSVELPQLLFL